MRRLIIVAALSALAAAALAFGTASAQEEGVPLSPLGDSGVSGSVTLTPSDLQTIIEVTVEGSEPDSTHPNHIHTGADCDNYTGIEVNLTDIAVGADGTGTATTTVDMPILDIENGNHVIVVHTGPTLQDDPTPIACAQPPVSIAEAPPAAEEPAAEEPVAAPPVAAPPTTGTGGFLREESGSIPVLPFILLGVAATFLAAGAVGRRLSRTRR